MATAPMIFSISALIAWHARGVRFIYQRNRPKLSFSKPKRTFYVCAKTFHWPMLNSLLWKRASVPMSGCLRHWLTCRRQGDLRRGNSRPDVWCNWKHCMAEKDRVESSRGQRESDHEFGYLRAASFSLITQRDRGINARRPSRGDITRHESHQHHEDGNRNKRHGIGGRNTIDHRGDETRGRKRRENTDDHASKS